MIESLQIRNFKGWQDTGIIDFAPITLFLGSNSSGKSSIGQFLMLLKQSCAFPDRGLCLPSDIKMTEEEQDSVIEIIRGCFQ